jgi:tRNA threonylcarbamoyladenosine biosynthesis protein TsaB
MILCIETATSVCSVSLCDPAGDTISKHSTEDKSHASLLTIYIKELLRQKKIRAVDLDAVAVSMGPGSYTGLRIGVSVAKGLAYGASIPLIAINTLESMYHGIKMTPRAMDADLLCPMIDARRMEVFSSFFDSAGQIVRSTNADVIDDQSYKDLLDKHIVLFFGNGAAKCSEVIKHPNARFMHDYNMSAETLCFPANEAFRENRFENVAYFEPFYLKDFIATVPKKNILGT